MPRYHLHLNECGSLTLDDEGRDLPDHDAALVVARHEARTMMAAEVLTGNLCLSCSIEVVQQDVGVAFIMPFKDALTVTGL